MNSNIQELTKQIELKLSEAKLAQEETEELLQIIKKELDF